MNTLTLEDIERMKSVLDEAHVPTENRILRMHKDTAYWFLIGECGHSHEKALKIIKDSLIADQIVEFRS